MSTFPAIFSDGDGVAADFDTGFMQRFGQPIKGIKVEDWQQLIADTQGAFYAELPLMPDVDYYWQKILPYKPVFLTGCPKIGYDLAVEAKQYYYHHHFGESYKAFHNEELKVITCLSRDKTLHMINPGDVLIDDMYYNIKKWEKEGGTGVYFKDAVQAIKTLQYKLHPTTK